MTRFDGRAEWSDGVLEKWSVGRRAAAKGCSDLVGFTRMVKWWFSFARLPPSSGFGRTSWRGDGGFSGVLSRDTVTS